MCGADLLLNRCPRVYWTKPTVDGGTGAKFLATLKQFIEEPASMLL